MNKDELTVLASLLARAATDKGATAVLVVVAGRNEEAEGGVREPWGYSYGSSPMAALGLATFAVDRLTNLIAGE